MGKLYEFYVTTTIRGKVQMVVEDYETPDEVADALEMDTVNYDEMERYGAPNVDTECDDFREVKESK